MVVVMMMVVMMMSIAANCNDDLSICGRG